MDYFDMSKFNPVVYSMLIQTIKDMVVMNILDTTNETRIKIIMEMGVKREMMEVITATPLM